MSERPSLYLLQKTEALAAAVEFFHRREDTRIVFLAQLDFWDWEMDNLIYSFQSFADRGVAWESAAALRAKISRLGIPLRKRVLRQVDVQRYWLKKADSARSNVRAPTEALAQVIERWNELLVKCEKKLLDRDADVAVKLGANLISDLSRYRKQTPDLATALAAVEQVQA